MITAFLLGWSYPMGASHLSFRPALAIKPAGRFYV